MKRSIAPVAVLVLLAASSASAQDWAQKMFKVTSHDFGTVARDAKTEFEFTLENPYLEDVHIASIRSSCGCTTPRVKDGNDTLKSWETTAIVAHINTDKFLGQKGATLTVTFDRPYYAQAQVSVRVNIRDDVVLNPGSVEFGTIDQGQAFLQSVAVGANHKQSWKILGVKSDNPNLSGEVTEVQRDWNQTVYHLTVRLEGTTPAGYLRDHVLLLTNDPTQPQVPVAVEAHVVAGITVGPRMLSLGVVRPGQTVSKQVVVKGKQPFRITGIQADGAGFQFEGLADQEPKQLHVVPVTFTAGSQPGTVVETIHIQTDLGGAVAEFSAQAIVAGEPAAGEAAAVAANEPAAERSQENAKVLETQRADASDAATPPPSTTPAAEPVETTEPATEPAPQPTATQPAVAETTVAAGATVPGPPGMPMPPFVARRLGLVQGTPSTAGTATASPMVDNGNPGPIGPMGRPLRGRVFGYMPGR